MIVIKKKKNEFDLTCKRGDYPRRLFTKKNNIRPKHYVYIQIILDGFQLISNQFRCAQDGRRQYYGLH